MANLRELQKAEESERLAAFRAELEELLERHGAKLDVTVEGDTHGVDDAYVDVSFMPRKDGYCTRYTEAFKLFDDA